MAWRLLTGLGRPSPTLPEADSDEAIRLLREGRAGLVGDGLITALVNLGGMLVDRFSGTRDIADLTEAVERLQEAAAIVPEASPLNTTVIFNLAIALGNLARADRDDDALDEAVELLRSLEGGHPAALVNRARISAELAELLELQHARSGEPGVRNRRVALLRRESRRLGRDDPDRPDSLVDLAVALIDDHVDTGAVASLDEGMAVLRELPEESISDSVLRVRFLVLLGHALTLRHSLRQEPGCLDEAVQVLREAWAVLGLPG